MKLTIRVVGMLTVMICIIMVPAFLVIWDKQQQTVIEQARLRALTIYQMIIVTRQWVAENRDRIEPVPAEATKELSIYANYMMTDFSFHITSDKLINPENVADDFENRAMEALKTTRGAEYAERYNDPEIGDIYRYAAPLLINVSCIQCHSHQGYIVDDFRGLISIKIPLTELEKSLQKSNSTYIQTVFFGFCGVLIVVSALLYRMVLRPLNTLTYAVGNIRKGDYSMRTGPSINTDDEIQELAEAFDTMSAQIAENEENLKAKLDEAVQKYVSLVDELQKANATLGTLNQLKTDFLDSIAHEIRTPLTKVMSYAELLNDPRFEDDKTSRIRFGEALKKHITALTAMFNDIITLSRLEHDQHPYHKIPVNLKDIIEDVFYTYERDLAEKQLNVSFNISPSLLLTVDGETFRYALTNIISNAVKYSHKGGTIHVSAVSDAEAVTISCRDEGVGIPEADLKMVVNRFHRGSNVKNYHGTGLGLAIVARVVRDHGGSMQLDSVLGEYTEIRITLPLG